MSRVKIGIMGGTAWIAVCVAILIGCPPTGGEVKTERSLRATEVAVAWGANMECAESETHPPFLICLVKDKKPKVLKCNKDGCRVLIPKIVEEPPP